MRARNIKPGYFINEVLGQADPYLQILFAGLWCLADKAGRLEDRPVRIKVEVFPYRGSLDVNGYLTELSRLGFIIRYQVGELKLIQVVNFSKHQSPHHTERESILPGIEYADGCHLTVVSPLDHGGNPPDSLIPDSLIPDSTSVQPPVDQPKQKPLKEKKGKAKIAEHSDEVKSVVNGLCGIWRTEHPANREKIHVSIPGFASRVEEILRDNKDLYGDILIQAGNDYCQEAHQWYKAPQYFFGPQGPWRDYVKHILTTTPKEEASVTE